MVTRDIDHLEVVRELRPADAMRPQRVPSKGEGGDGLSRRLRYTQFHFM